MGCIQAYIGINEGHSTLRMSEWRMDKWKNSFGMGRIWGFGRDKSQYRGCIILLSGSIRYPK